MVDFVISIVLMPTLLVAREARDGRGAAGALLRGAAQGGGEVLVRAPRARAGGVADGGGDCRARHLPAARRHQPHQLLQRRPPAGPVGGRHRQRARRASTASRSCSRGRPSRCKTPDALQRMDRLERGAADVAVRPQGDVGRRLREAHQPGAQRRAAGSQRRARRCRARSRRSCSCSRSADEGRRELERVVASDYSRAQIADQAGVDELGPRLRADRAGGADGEGDVRRHRHQRAHDRLRPAVQHARSLSGDVAAQQLRHGVRHRLRRHLPRVPIVPVRRCWRSSRTCCRCWRCSA